MSDPRPPGRVHRTAWGLLLVVLALSACTSSSADLPPLPAAFDDGVPAPSGEVVLTVTTDDGAVDWDPAALALLDQHSLRILEPFVETVHTYTGPLWMDVLRASGVPLDADRAVELVALDDYVSEIPADTAALEGVVLAHLEDGASIPIARGGPIRLVYPEDNPLGDNASLWIWSIRTAVVM